MSQIVNLSVLSLVESLVMTLRQNKMSGIIYFAHIYYFMAFKRTGGLFFCKRYRHCGRVYAVTFERKHISKIPDTLFQMNTR